MGKMIKAWAVAAVLVWLGACGDPCADLRRLCGKCDDTLVKRSCEDELALARVPPNSEEKCQVVIDDATFAVCE